MSTSTRRGRKILFLILSIFVGLVLVALLTEGLVRIFFDVRVTPRYVIDSGYGVRANQPNIVRREYVPGVYEISISTNSAGMRGTREYSVAKPNDIKRILILGDSFAFGMGVEDDEVLSAILEDLLNAESDGDKIYEVLNLGVVAFGQAEELIEYSKRGRDFEPDIVVSLYFENDIVNNQASRLFTLDEEGGVRRSGDAYLPGVKLRGMLYGIPGARWLANHSDAWHFVLNRVSTLLHRSMARDLTLDNSTDIAKNSQSRNLTKALILQLVTDVRADGARSIIVIIPDRRTGMKSNFPLDTETLNELNVEFLDGREYLIEDDYYLLDAHWKVSGHRKTAKKLAAMID